MLALLILSFLHSQVVNAWGDLGHETIGWIAQNYVSSTTKTLIEKVLDSKASDYIANVSTWADSYRYTSEGAFSYPYHFIDANDNPPTSCSVDFSRDCGEGGCSISAIVNYTAVLLDASASQSNKLDAMKFVIHFVGDLHQPLHDEAIEIGGNDINVTYGSEHTNLHHIWDTEIPTELSNSSDAETFAKTLIASIKGGDYGWDVSTWLDGTNINDTQGSAMTWATEANSYVCSDVLVGGIDAVEKGDLSGSYYKTHVEVARVQIARAGYRLGAWLNLIATGSLTG